MKKVIVVPVVPPAIGVVLRPTRKRSETFKPARKTTLKLKGLHTALSLQEQLQKFGFTSVEIVTINHTNQLNTCVKK
jgi:hypothetical protein